MWLIRTTSGRFTYLFLSLVNLRDLFGIGTKLNESIFKNNNQIISLINQSMALVNRMNWNVAKYSFGIQMKKWWWSPFVSGVVVALQGAWVLYCVN